MNLNVDIYPTEPRVVTRGSYVVENRTNGPLSEVHVSWPRQLELKSFLGPFVVAEVQMRSLEVTGAKMTQEFPDLHYRIYTFDQPLASRAACRGAFRDRARAARFQEHQ